MSSESNEQTLLVIQVQDASNVKVANSDTKWKRLCTLCLQYILKLCLSFVQGNVEEEFMPWSPGFLEEKIKIEWKYKFIDSVAYWIIRKILKINRVSFPDKHYPSCDEEFVKLIKNIWKLDQQRPENDSTRLIYKVCNIHFDRLISKELLDYMEAYLNYDYSALNRGIFHHCFIVNHGKYDYKTSLRLYQLFKGNNQNYQDFSDSLIQDTLYKILLTVNRPSVELEDIENIFNFLLNEYNLKLTSKLPSSQTTILHLICKYDYKLLVKFLDVLREECESNGNINVQDRRGDTALHLICLENVHGSNYEYVLNFFIDHPQTNVNLPNNHGDTPLLKAFHLNNRLAIEKLLSREEIDVDNFIGEEKQSARRIIEDKYPEFVHLLPGIRIPTENEQFFKWLYMEGEDTFIEYFQRNDVLFNDVRTNGNMTLLNVACLLSLSKVVMFLLSKGHYRKPKLMIESALFNAYYLQRLINHKNKETEQIVVRLLDSGVDFLKHNFPTHLNKAILNSLVKRERDLLYLDFRSSLTSDSQDTFEAEKKMFETFASETYEALSHPVVTCLLILKCFLIRRVQYFQLSLNFLFWSSLAIYLAFPTYTVYSNVFLIFMCISKFCLCLSEIFLSEFNVITDIPKLFLSLSPLCLLFVNLQSNNTLVAIPIVLIITYAIFFMQSIGKSPRFFIKTRIVSKVGQNYFKLFCWFLVFLISYSIVFLLLTLGNTDLSLFDWLIKSFLMMTGDFNIDDIKYTSHPVIFQITFALFVFFFFFVITNVLQALAISDVQSITESVEIESYKSRVKQIIGFNQGVSNLKSSPLSKYLGKVFDLDKFLKEYEIYSKLNQQFFITNDCKFLQLMDKGNLLKISVDSRIANFFKEKMDSYKSESFQDNNKERIYEKLNVMSTLSKSKFEQIEYKQNQMNHKIEQNESRLENMEKKVDMLIEMMRRSEKKLNEIQAKIDF